MVQYTMYLNVKNKILFIVVGNIKITVPFYTKNWTTCSKIAISGYWNWPIAKTGRGRIWSSTLSRILRHGIYAFLHNLLLPKCPTETSVQSFQSSSQTLWIHPSVLQHLVFLFHLPAPGTCTNWCVGGDAINSSNPLSFYIPTSYSSQHQDISMNQIFTSNRYSSWFRKQGTS